MRRKNFARIFSRFSAKLFSIGLATVALSCGHYQSPKYQRPELSGPGEYKTQGEFLAQGEYSTQGDYSTADELYSSKDVADSRAKKARRGPFRLQWPVKNLKLNRGYIGGGKRVHRGVDVAGRRGTLIYAAHDGTVIYSGSKFRGYGRMILLEYNDKWATLYAHLDKSRVKNGQEVKAGDVIGEMGRTGRATGVHLHFELMRDKQPIDPMPFLKAQSLSARF